MSQRAGRCWYCGRASLRDDDPLEHIIPAALQGTLTTNRVCFSCNQAVSSLDQQFLGEWWLAVPRSEYGTPDRRGKTPPLPRQRATLTDGTPVRINTADEWRAEVFLTVEDLGDGKFLVSAASEEEAQRKIEEIRRKAGSDAKVVVEGVSKIESPPPTATVTVKIRPSVTFRMTIKMALGTLSLVWDDSWLDTTQAKQLQAWLHDPMPRGDDGNPLALVPAGTTPALEQVCLAPAHLLMLQGGDAAPSTYFCALLMGEHRTGLEIARSGQPQLQRAWWMDGVGGATVSSTVAELVARKLAPERPDGDDAA